MSRRSEALEQKNIIRTAAEHDLYTFACLVNPMRVYGQVHEDVFRWLQRYDVDQLLLLPRAHMKSHCIAVWCAWWITTHPETTILYISATSELAEKQLYDIKNMITCKQYRKYWPEMVNSEEGKREKWATKAFSLDHPKRKEEGVRDHTVSAAGLTTNTTGWHADVVIADDVVVPDNAYTETGRHTVESAMSQIESVLNPGGFTKACGTRYHPLDIYGKWLPMKIPEYDEEDNIIGYVPVWDKFERVVEEDGLYIWPRTVREDGKSFGFDDRVLSKIKAKYLDVTQFHAQYYNDPNDVGSSRMSKDAFLYYEPASIKKVNGTWTHNGAPLNIYAAIDFAFSLSSRADYTALVVVGVDPEGFIYVLDIDRFKTDDISVYYEHIMNRHDYWNFKKLRAEITGAQKIIVKDLRDRVRKAGQSLVIDDFNPTAKQGSKEERVDSILLIRYRDGIIRHAKGGLTNLLEEEIIQARPAHDDIKDALASAVEISVAPRAKRDVASRTKLVYNKRFGGVINA